MAWRLRVRTSTQSRFFYSVWLWINLWRIWRGKNGLVELHISSALCRLLLMSVTVVLGCFFFISSKCLLSNLLSCRSHQHLKNENLISCVTMTFFDVKRMFSGYTKNWTHSSFGGESMPPSFYNLTENVTKVTGVPTIPPWRIVEKCWQAIFFFCRSHNTSVVLALLWLHNLEKRMCLSEKDQTYSKVVLKALWVQIPKTVWRDSGEKSSTRVCGPQKW